MAKPYRFNQVDPESMGIIAPGVVLPISELRIPLGDGTKAILHPPVGKEFFEDGDEIDLDTLGNPGQVRRMERLLSKDPRFTKRP